MDLGLSLNFTYGILCGFHDSGEGGWEKGEWIHGSRAHDSGTLLEHRAETHRNDS